MDAWWALGRLAGLRGAQLMWGRGTEEEGNGRLEAC